jgi:hypothetical protein
MEEMPSLLDVEEQLRQSRSVEFNYLLLFDHHADGATGIRELRTDFKNRQVGSSVDGVAPRGFGFAYQWLLLSPENQSELRFRYLGKQRMDDHQNTSGPERKFHSSSRALRGSISQPLTLSGCAPIFCRRSQASTCSK